MRILGGIACVLKSVELEYFLQRTQIRVADVYGDLRSKDFSLMGNVFGGCLSYVWIDVGH